MFLTINLLFISMNIFGSEVVWNIVPFATESEFGLCPGQPGKLYSHFQPVYFRKSPLGSYWVANMLHSHKVLLFWKTVLLCYSEVYLLKIMVPLCFSESVWVILWLLPRGLVYDKWNHAVTLVASIYYPCFVVLKVKIANWFMLWLVGLLLLKYFRTSADCILFHFQDQMPFSVCLVPKKGLTLHAGMCTLKMLCFYHSRFVLYTAQACEKEGKHSQIHTSTGKVLHNPYRQLVKTTETWWVVEADLVGCLPLSVWDPRLLAAAQEAKLSKWTLLRSCNKEETLVDEIFGYT